MLQRSLRRLCFAAAAEAKAAAAMSAPFQRDIEYFDVVVVGGGPAGLSAAIRLKQLAGGEDLRIGVLDKGSEIGAHTMSGACIEDRSMLELFPDFHSRDDLPTLTPATDDDDFLLLTSQTRSVRSPWVPHGLRNDGNYVTSLGAVTKWLGERAEELGVEIYPGFAASHVMINDAGAVEGVQLHDMGVDKKGERTPQFEPGMLFKSKQTIFAEGCRGSCTKYLEQRFQLRKESGPQTYGLGIKEVWEIPAEKHHPGRTLHTVGWPTTDKGHQNTYGGGFLYHYGDGLVSCGYVVGLDYRNPHCRPYMEMQKWKTHDAIRAQLEGGRPILYGARALSEGGLCALPKLHVPGAVLVGDCAGFLNLPKIKGTHTAMKSGILAAEAVYGDVFAKGNAAPGMECTSYTDRFRESWLYKELYEVRNVRQHFAKNFYWGMLYTGITSALTKGREPWNLPHHSDHTSLLPAAECTPIEYPKPDGKLTFDLLTSHSRSGTTHNADQPCHLRLTNPDVAVDVNLRVYGGPEAKYCPAGVYEFVDGKLVINAQNCLHCKTCDIKDPTQNITWAVPEGSGGPSYQAQM